jgi:hypothetical protein
MDNVGTRSDTWESHLEILSHTLEALDCNGFAINPAKCEWGVQTTKWLGHILTPEGFKPDPRKVEAILAMQPPTTVRPLLSTMSREERVRLETPMTRNSSLVLSTTTSQRW